MFYNLFGLSFWWHPFTAEDPFLQICPDKTNKLIKYWRSDGKYIIVIFVGVGRVKYSFYVLATML